VTTISANDIEAIVEMFERSQWKELELQFGGCELFLGKDASGRATWESRAGANAPSVPATGKPVAAAAAPAPATAPATNTASQRSAFDPAAVAAGHRVIPAPSLGSFYRSAKPGTAPFVQVGEKVTEDTELCLIEVMKLFTTLRAGVAGVVREVLAKDGDLVEFGQPLFVIDTNG
jgi:acetyl-CoA carboxylase biotin carboxyl carrier protein